MSRRRLSDEERVLWKGVTRSIMPLRQSLANVADADIQQSLAELPEQGEPQWPSSTIYQPQERQRYTLTRLPRRHDGTLLWAVRSAHDRLLLSGA